MRALRYCLTPSRLVSVSLSDGLSRKRISHAGFDARAFADQAGRLLIFPVRILVARQPHEDRGLPDVHLVAAHAIVFADHPPAVDDVLPLIGRLVVVALGHGGIDRAQQERRHLIDLRLRQIEVRHLQPVELVGLFLALIVDGRIFQLVLEEALVRVPALALGFVTQEREIQALERLRAFLGQLGADALLFFEAGDLMASGAAVIADQELAVAP